ncbi:SDR family oxidoreductase, partial [Endobacter medicaginis]
MSPRNVAVITGATQRLGTALARRLAQSGVSLALVDGDAGALARLERELASNRIVVSTHVADPADPGAAADVATAALAVHGRVDQLYAAARADADRAFADLPAGEFDRVMAVVARTPIALVRALLPSLVAGGAGRVVVF